MLKYFCPLLFLLIKPIEGNVVSKSNTNITSQLITDLIQNQTETTNIDFFTDTQHREILHQVLQLEAKLDLTITLSEYADVNEDEAEIINNAEDNTPAFYIVIQPEDDTFNNTNEVVKKLRKWDQNAKIVIIFHTKVDVRIYAEEKIYNIYLFTPAAGPREVSGYTQYDVCHLCDKGNDAVKLSNTWRRSAAAGERAVFKHRVTFPNSFQGNFNGKVLTMGTLNTKPHIYVTGKDGKGQVTREGNFYQNYMVLEKMLNTKWNFQHATSGNQFKLVSDGKPTGLMKDLVDGRVDIVSGGWVGRYSRYKHADFSASSYYGKPFRLISMEPHREMQWFALLEPFKWHMWILILGIVLADGIMRYVVRRVSRFSEREAVFSDSIWEATVIICWDCIRSCSPPGSTFLLHTFYLFTCFLLVSIYMGEYTAAVLKPSYNTPPVDTFSQLFNETDRKILSFGAWHRYYINYFKDEVHNIEERMETPIKGPSPSLKIIKLLQNNPEKYVYLYTSYGIESFATEASNSGSQKFYYGKDTMPPVYLNLLLPKKFQYNEFLDRKLNLMHAMGLMDQIWKRYGGPAKLVAVDKMYHKTEELALLEFKQFLGALVLLLSGYFCSTLAFCMEMVWAWAKWKKKTKQSSHNEKGTGTTKIGMEAETRGTC